jgi:mannose-6-phosphate isomerase-like protein (cupin superfamily)
MFRYIGVTRVPFSDWERIHLTSIVSTDLNEGSLYFAYRRVSVDNQHHETFHSHRGIEILMIHDGKGTMIVNNVSYAIQPGMLCVFQPFQLHHLQLDYSGRQSFERSIAIFEPTMFEA